MPKKAAEAERKNELVASALRHVAAAKLGLSPEGMAAERSRVRGEYLALSKQLHALSLGAARARRTSPAQRELEDRLLEAQVWIEELGLGTCEFCEREASWWSSRDDGDVWFTCDACHRRDLERGPLTRDELAGSASPRGARPAGT
jgi:hypothetical protein